jgi:hypothetical protein
MPWRGDNFVAKLEMKRITTSCLPGVDPKDCVAADDMCHCTDDESFSNLSTIGWIFTFTFPRPVH